MFETYFIHDPFPVIGKRRLIPAKKKKKIQQKQNKTKQNKKKKNEK